MSSETLTAQPSTPTSEEMQEKLETAVSLGAQSAIIFLYGGQFIDKDTFFDALTLAQEEVMTIVKTASVAMAVFQMSGVFDDESGEAQDASEGDEGAVSPAADSPTA